MRAFLRCVAKSVCTFAAAALCVRSRHALVRWITALHSGNLIKSSHRDCHCSGSEEEEAAKLGASSGSNTAAPRRTQKRPLKHWYLQSSPVTLPRPCQSPSHAEGDFITVVSKAAQRRARALKAADAVTDPAVVGTQAAPRHRLSRSCDCGDQGRGTVKLHFSRHSPADCIHLRAAAACAARETTSTTVLAVWSRYHVRPRYRVMPVPRRLHASNVAASKRRPDVCNRHGVKCGGVHLVPSPTCAGCQEERSVATLTATTPTLLSRRAVRAAVHEERREVRLYAASLKASPPPSSKVPGQPRTPSAPRQLNLPEAPSTEVQLPAAHHVTLRMRETLTSISS
ncbi:hypothetical protein MRX96_017252 [Rhipicephalus microplus]